MDSLTFSSILKMKFLPLFYTVWIKKETKRREAMKEAGRDKWRRREEGRFD